MRPSVQYHAAHTFKYEAQHVFIRVGAL